MKAHLQLTLVSFILSSTVRVWCKTICGVSTTSGYLIGSRAHGVTSFKGIVNSFHDLFGIDDGDDLIQRFAHPPVAQLRWEPPVPFNSFDIHDATSLGPSCVQQFPFALITDLYNTPPPPEDEDCLFLNVWAPESMSSRKLKPVVVWIYGGAFMFGTASMPMYDGESFAKNQDVIVVSFNYRTNIFGFPWAPDLSPTGNNLGFLDQELALAWIQENIAQFGGDKNKVTVMGHSAGAMSISLAITRRNSSMVLPFRAAIMLSGVMISASPVPNFAPFEGFARAMGCSQSPGPERLDYLRKIPAHTIRHYTNANPLISFDPQVDNVTFIDDSLKAIRTRQIPRVPILLGTVEDEGTISVPAYPNLTVFLEVEFGELSSSCLPNVTALYPRLNGTQIYPAVIRDVLFHCPTKLWSDALVTSGIENVHRYTYGATFHDLELFPNLGVWHGSELRVIFGTFNKSTATTDEAELSHTLQTAFRKFVKDPGSDFAPNWPRYSANPSFPTLAKIAYRGNVQPDNFVEPVDPSDTDGPCVEWNRLLDFRP